MRVILVLAHPQPGSFNHQIAQTALTELQLHGHEVELHDLYEIGFNPLLTPAPLLPDGTLDQPLDVKKQIQAVDWANGMIFVYPIWWWERPAILKGWFDWVFIWGMAIEMQPLGHRGLFKDKRALVFQTCGNSEERSIELSAEEVLHGTIREGTLELCGVRVDSVDTFYQANRLDKAQREAILDQVRARCRAWNGL